MSPLLFWIPPVIWLLIQWRKAHLRVVDRRMALHARRYAYRHAECPESTGQREGRVH